MSGNLRAPAEGDGGRAKGGYERARRMTPEQRSAAAKRAADARWSIEVVEAVCGSPDQPLLIGDAELECYVLANGTRVLSQATFLRALGRHPKANVRPARPGEDDRLPPMLRGVGLEHFVTDEMRERSRPIIFKRPEGGRASGYDAELLPDVCEVYLRARQDGTLNRQHVKAAAQAELLMRGLARVGITALVDEATGYQEIRERDALARILEEFIAKELRPWVSTFPPDFYSQMYRLRGLEYPPTTNHRPQYFGRLTNNVVYDRLAPGVRRELEKANPTNAKGRRKARHHQHLTDNVGYPKLREHLGSVVTLMKLSNDWDDFKRKLDQIHPRVGDTMQLPLDG